MPHRDKFVHLHTHSEFSLLDGAARISDLVKSVKEMGMPALAVTDHGNMYATIKFYRAAKDAGIKPIIGCEMYIAPRTRFDKETKEDRSPYHLTVIARNDVGYRNLIKLVTTASFEGFYAKPRIDRELLEKYSKGLVILSGCPKGELSCLLLEDNFKKAEGVIKWFKEIFAEDYYLEIQDVGLEENKKINPHLIRLGKELGVKLVATNDVHYVKKEDAYPQDVLLCIQTGVFLDDNNRMKLQTDEFYLKSYEEMAVKFAEIPEALHNSLEIAEKCGLEIEMEKLHLPHFPVPEGEDPDSYLEKLVWEGIKKKYGVAYSSDGIAEDKTLLPPEIIDRVKYELYTIEKMGYAAYFLIVQDFVNYAKGKGIQVGPGRGSAAGSIVSYALGITNVDPLKYGLIFERFLNLERVTMPDIDIDFCFERRGEVIDYVTKKYGQDHVAQIVTFGTMAARGAIRDVGRVQKIPLPEVDKIAKMVPFGPEVALESSVKNVKELRAAYEKDEKVKTLIDTAMKIEGLSRHASVHAAGVVISEEPLTEYSPLQKLDENVVVTQYTMEDLEKIGLLKMDFLGLRNLTMIAHAVELVKKTQGIEIDINNITINDTRTYQLLCSGETMGIFQLESRGMRALIKDLKPNTFEEIIALLALYRPGPLESGMVEDFVKRKHDKTPIRHELQELQPILRETYGVILYQEQVMEIASKIAGFSMGQADVLRQAMGKKKVKEMQLQREHFIEGAVKRGVSRHKATELFNQCAKFAGYGFNKSHSTAYGIIAYQTAYLKANYPVEFMAALMTSVMGNTDKVTAYINEAKRIGLKILGPDVNGSDQNFTVTPEGIRFGLSAVKNVGTAAIESIIEARGEGKFSALMDFCRRVDSRKVTKKVIESLIKAGAFDSLGQSRAYYLSALEKTMSRISAEQRERANGQASLFTASPSSPSFEEEKEVEIEVKEFSLEDLLKMEKEMVGLYISSHPLEYLRDSLEGQTNTRITDIGEMREGEMVTVGGLLEECRKITTKKGDTMLLANIEDLTGSIPLVVFPKAYEKAAALLNDDEVVVVKGRINRDMRTEEYNIVAESVTPMEELEKVRSLHIELIGIKDKEVLGRMKEILNFFKGEDPVIIRMEGKTIQLGNGYGVSILPELVERLENLLGSGSVNVEFKAVKRKAAEREEVSF